jgi:hypothetical protein
MKPTLTIKRVERHAGYPDLWIVANGRTLFFSYAQACELCDGLNRILDDETVLVYENESARLVREAAETRERNINSKTFAPLPKPRTPTLDDLA